MARATSPPLPSAPAAAGTWQGHGGGGDVLGLCDDHGVQLRSPPRVTAAPAAGPRDAGAPVTLTGTLPAAGGAAGHSPLQADGGLHPGPGHGLAAVLDLGPGAGMLGVTGSPCPREQRPPLAPLTSRL